MCGLIVSRFRLGINHLNRLFFVHAIPTRSISEIRVDASGCPCSAKTAHSGGQLRTGATIKQAEEKQGKHKESLNSPVFSAIGETSIGKYPQGDSNPLPISRKGKARKEVTANPPEFAAQTLAHEKRIGPEIDADLGRLIAAWPTLPTPIRIGILAMIEAARNSYPMGCRLEPGEARADRTT